MRSRSWFLLLAFFQARHVAEGALYQFLNPRILRVRRHGMAIVKKSPFLHGLHPGSCRLGHRILFEVFDVRLIHQFGDREPPSPGARASMPLKYLKRSLSVVRTSVVPPEIMSL